MEYSFDNNVSSIITVFDKLTTFVSIFIKDYYIRFTISNFNNTELIAIFITVIVEMIRRKLIWLRFFILNLLFYS